jgi:hypothetical protein
MLPWPQRITACWRRAGTGDRHAVEAHSRWTCGLHVWVRVHPTRRRRAVVSPAVRHAEGGVRTGCAHRTEWCPRRAPWGAPRPPGKYVARTLKLLDRAKRGSAGSFQALCVVWGWSMMGRSRNQTRSGLRSIVERSTSCASSRRCLHYSPWLSEGPFPGPAYVRAPFLWGHSCKPLQSSSTLAISSVQERTPSSGGQ